MSDDDDDHLETFSYRGEEDERIPLVVQKLIVREGVKVLPHGLMSANYPNLQKVCLPKSLTEIGPEAFYRCTSLLEIWICSTVKYIEEGAFWDCEQLKQLEFESSASTPHELESIDDYAFRNCESLQRIINLPSSVTFIGDCAFEHCFTLIEANLSSTGLSRISCGAFGRCLVLQTASLPKTVVQICENAFFGCESLVTVIVPLGSQPIRIGRRSFNDCKQLASFGLPKGCTVEQDSFSGCDLLEKRYGEESSSILSGLIGRFKKIPIHRMCYYQSATTVARLRKSIAKLQSGDLLVDQFGMTPFHILFSTIEPNKELFEVLLDLLPIHMLKWEDANGAKPFDYLIMNWTDDARCLFQKTAQKWMIDGIAAWGATSWMEDMKSMVEELVATEGDGDCDERYTLYDNACALFEHFGAVAGTSILEMALWKRHLKSGRTTDGAKRKALDRAECRCLCGADVVIPHVAMFLIHSEADASDEEEDPEGDSSSEHDAPAAGDDSSIDSDIQDFYDSLGAF